MKYLIMKIYFFASILMVHFIGIITAKCNYSETVRDFKGFKLLKIPNGYIITKNKNTYISSGRNVVLYCEEGFLLQRKSRHSFDITKPKNIGEFLTIYCEEDKVRLSSEDKFNLLEDDTEYDIRDYYVACNSVSAKFYGAKLEHCDYEGLRRGIKVNNVPIVSVELCYDFNNSEPIFAHYVASKRSVVLERQGDYNPSAVTEYDLSSNFTVDLEEQDPPEIDLANNYSLFHTSSKQLLLGINYAFDELASNNIYAALNVEIFKYEFNILNSVPWWKGLRIGNWKIFENIIERQIETESYDIYAGKSHRASFPKEFVCNSEYDMSFDFNGQRKHIPLYIWNYISPLNQTKASQDFVLIAINSPFAETDELSSLVICADMCDEISWLKPLQATRKMPSFGYIFCCHPKDVYMMLDGFPGMKFSNPTN